MVDAGAISMATLDAAVSHTLTAMFGFGLIASPRPTTIQADVAPAADAHVALQAAEDSMVLLKNKGHALPLTPATRTIAVIGSDAGPAATTSGRGSSQVRASLGCQPHPCSQGCAREKRPDHLHAGRFAVALAPPHSGQGPHRHPAAHPDADP